LYFVNLSITFVGYSKVSRGDNSPLFHYPAV
jgi:hypothetical protein